MGKSLPCKECGGKCCTYAPFPLKEYEAIKHKITEPAELMPFLENTPRAAVMILKPGTQGECYFLKDGRCEIYYRRPLTCRAMGEKIPCQYTNPEEALNYTESALRRLS